jgi:methylmalonyl-CoA mutase
MNLAVKKEALLGVNIYPNANEKMEKGYDESTIQAKSQKTEDAIAEPIKPYRGGEELETLRFKTDKHPQGAPKVFMFTIGNAKMRRARAQFSAGFFAAAGFEIIDNIGFDTVGEGVKEARKQDADIVVICSSDQEYPEVAPQINDQMKKDAIVVLAGYPKDSMDELKEKGIQHFIHIKSNLIETLKGFQQQLGIV